MGMRRQERVALHKKQERLQIGEGIPTLSDLKEGVPVLRSTPEGVVEYVKHNGVLHKKIFDRAERKSVVGGPGEPGGPGPPGPPGEPASFAVPDYDSGWVWIEKQAAVGNKYELTHNLNSKMLLSHAYFKFADDAAVGPGAVFNITSCFIEEGTDDTTLSLYMKTNDILEVATGNEHVFLHDNTSLSDDMIVADEGWFRIFLWKLDVEE